MILFDVGDTQSHSLVLSPSLSSICLHLILLPLNDRLLLLVGGRDDLDIGIICQVGGGNRSRSCSGSGIRDNGRFRGIFFLESAK
jgi:hypothetical protein